MKTIYYLLTLTILLLVISCKKNESKLEINNDIIGKWKLTESYADPGDGSGTWQTKTSNKTLEFKKSGDLIVENGALCFGDGDHETKVATYEISPSNSIQAQNATYILKVTGCDPAMFMFENGRLMIFYPCIEGCGERFERIN